MLPADIITKKDGSIFVRATLKRFIDLIGIRLGACNPSDAVVIAGAPRTGTTWIMEVLEHLPGYKTVFEPLHQSRFFRSSVDFPPRIYLNPGEDSPVLRQYLDDVFSGTALSATPHYPMTMRHVFRRLTASRVIVKFINGNRLLPWMLEQYTPAATFLVIRHPCATIASQLKSGWIGYPRELELAYRRGNVKSLREAVVRGASDIPGVADKDNLLGKIRGLDSIEELLAVEWSLDYYVPKCYRDTMSCRWISYEELVKREEEVFADMVMEIGVSRPAKIEVDMAKPSSTSKVETIQAERQLTKWKDYLSERQTERILDVVSWFGLDFYTEDPEPDYEHIQAMSSPH